VGVSFYNKITALHLKLRRGGVMRFDGQFEEPMELRSLVTSSF